jgi:hypothetical protein
MVDDRVLDLNKTSKQDRTNCLSHRTAVTVSTLRLPRRSREAESLVLCRLLGKELLNGRGQNVIHCSDYSTQKVPMKSRSSESLVCCQLFGSPIRESIDRRSSWLGVQYSTEKSRETESLVWGLKVFRPTGALPPPKNIHSFTHPPIIPQSSFH